MFRAYVDGSLFYDDSIPQENLKILSPKLDLGENSAGTFSFVVPPTNIRYGLFDRLTSNVVIEKLDSGDTYWEGRVVEISEDFWKCQTITCEGSLAYLNDTIQPNASYPSRTPREFVFELLNKHNAKVSANKRIMFGNVSISDTTRADRYTNFETTFELIKKQVEVSGGHVSIRYLSGNRYFDWTDEYDENPVQSIEFGENLLDYSSNMTINDFCTVLIPQGVKLEETDGDFDMYLDVASVNGGSIYVSLTSSDFPSPPSVLPIDIFGRIEKVQKWEEIVVPENLLSRAKKYLKEQQFNELVLDISAFDLRYADSSYNSIEISNTVRVISAPHGLDKVFPVTKMSVPLDSPESTSFTLGGSTVMESLTSYSRRNNSILRDQIDAKPSEAKITNKYKEEIAAELEKATTGYVNIISTDSGSQELVISDTPDYLTAQKIWRWNLNGLAFSSHGYAQGPYELALTADGKINASLISTGVLNADLITAGILQDQNDGEHFRLNLATGELYIGGYATDDEVSTAVQVAVDGIRTYVDSTYTTKEEFENLNVGAINYLLGTQKMKGWSKGAGATVDDTGEYAIATLNGSSSNWSAALTASPTRDISILDGSSFTFSMLYSAVTDVVFNVTLASTARAPGSASGARTKYATFRSQTIPSTNGAWKTWSYTVDNITPEFMTAGSGDQNSWYITVYCRTNDAALKIQKLKFEKGNQATDWSPAPEDLEQGAKDYTDGKLSAYSTTVEMNSAIEQTAEAITQTVSETYTTKLEFENLEIGGENLLPDSDAPTLAATYKPNGATTADSRYFSGTKPDAGTYTLEWIPLPSDIPAPPISVKHCAHYVYPDTTTNSLLNGIAWRDRYVPMVAGETYTMSAWFYVKSGSLNVQFQYGNGRYKLESSDMSEGSAWERRSWTFVADASCITAGSGDIKAWTRPYMGCGYKKGIAAEAYVCGFKMEIGNRATAWGPDTDDIIYKMESYETQIEQNSREIALRATKEELNNLSIGGRNYLKWSDDSSKWKQYTPDAYRVAIIELYENMVPGKEYTLTIWGTEPTRSDKTNCWYAAYWGGATLRIPGPIYITNGVGSVTFTAPEQEGLLPQINIYNTPGSGASGTTYTASISRIKLEEGNKSTDWTPAPEDLGSRVTNAEAELSIQAEQIASKVSTTDYNGNKIASLINQNSTTVQISASHVDLQGAVTVSAFDSTTQGLLVKNATSKNQYVQSTSDTEAPTEGWLDVVPAYDPEKRYIWMRIVLTKTYTDNTVKTTYSDPICDVNLTKAIEDAALAQDSIDNLEIGGTNLLPDSNAPSFTKVSGTISRYLSDTAQSAYVTGEFIEITGPPVPGIKNGYKLSCIEESTTAGQRGYTWRDTETLISLIPGEEYTLSCYVRKLSGTPKINQRYGYVRGSTWSYPTSVPISEGIEVTWTEWQKVSWTFTYNATATSTHPRIYAIQLANYSLGEIEACGFKLEKGNVATAWSPAPIDSEYAISISVKGADVEYYKSTSPTSLAGGQWQTITPSWEEGYYIWTRTKWNQYDGTSTYSNPTCITGNTGEKGDKGDPGTAATTYFVQSSDEVIVKNQSGSFVPASITFSAKSNTGEESPISYAGRFKIFESVNGSSWTLKYTSSANEGSKTYTPSANTVKFVKCELYLKGATPSTSTFLDSQTVPVVSDGINGTNGVDGKDGTNGVDGKDAYTVILTNENHTFAGSTTAAIASETTCNIISYKGATKIAATIGSITGAPTGMTVTPSGSGTTNASFTVAVTDSMTTKNGVLTIPVTVDSKTFDMKFTYSLALKGDSGKGVRTITNYYAVNNSTTAPADSAFSTVVVAPTASNRYLWNYELITYSDNSTSTSNKHIMAVYGEKGTKGDTGNDGKGIASIVEYYALSTTTTAPGDSSFDTTVKTMTSTNKYLWNYEKIIYSDNTEERTEKRIIGVYGTQGDTGKGISSVTELYYSSDSSTTPAAPTATVTLNDPTKHNQWNKACANWTETYKYYYTCSEIKYTDNTYAWTNVSINNGYNTANAAASSASDMANKATQIIGGYAIKWNASTFSNTNNGEGYICRFDPTTGTQTDADGWVMWNGIKRTISKGVINPDTKLPYNIPIYVVCRLSEASAVVGTNYLVWYNSGWKYLTTGINAASATEEDIDTWTWAINKDFVIGKFVEPGSEAAFIECEIYNPPLYSNQVTPSGITASSALNAANSAQSTADSAAANSPVINLLPMIYWSEYTKGTRFAANGISWTINKDGSVTAKGTATANSSCLLSGSTLANDVPVITLDPSKRYYLSGCPSGGSSTTYRIGARTTPEGTDPSSSTGSINYDYGNGVLLTANRKYAYVYCTIMNGFACPEEGITFYPLLETGSVKHSYVSSRGGMVGLTTKTLKTVDSLYYRRTIPLKPTIDKDTVIQNDQDNMDNAWTTTIPRPMKHRWYYTCEKFTYVDGTIAFSDVRRISDLTATSVWCSANDQTLFDGANIYTGSVTADKIKANSIFTQKLTATDFTITGGSIQIDTNNSTYDALTLNYQGAGGALLRTKIQPGSVQVSSDSTSVHLDADGIRFTENGETKGWLPATGIKFVEYSSITNVQTELPVERTLLRAITLAMRKLENYLVGIDSELTAGTFILIRYTVNITGFESYQDGNGEYTFLFALGMNYSTSGYGEYGKYGTGMCINNTKAYLTNSTADSFCLWTILYRKGTGNPSCYISRNMLQTT